MADVTGFLRIAPVFSPGFCQDQGWLQLSQNWSLGLRGVLLLLLVVVYA